MTVVSVLSVILAGGVFLGAEILIDCYERWLAKREWESIAERERFDREFRQVPR